MLLLVGVLYQRTVSRLPVRGGKLGPIPDSPYGNTAHGILNAASACSLLPPHSPPAITITPWTIVLTSCTLRPSVCIFASRVALDAHIYVSSASY